MKNNISTITKTHKILIKFLATTNAIMILHILSNITIFNNHSSENYHNSYYDAPFEHHQPNSKYESGNHEFHQMKYDIKCLKINELNRRVDYQHRQNNTNYYMVRISN